MSDIDIKGTEETPTVEFKNNDGYLLIEGRSIPENSSEFYQPLIDSLSDYKSSPSSKIKVDFRFEYFNTSSSKCILDILKKLQEIRDAGNDVVVDWYYEEEDDEILEIGEDYSHIVNVPFNLKMINNN